jgi:hypothetical protein
VVAGLDAVTPGPVAVTVPAKSEPIARGKDLPVIIFSAPWRTFQSIGLMAAVTTETATSPSFGEDRTKSSSRIVSGAP